MSYISINRPPAEISSFEEALYHTGSQADFEQRLLDFLAKPNSANRLELDSASLRKLLNDDRNLRLAFRKLQLKGEKAPGVDGIRFEDIPACELPPLLRDVSRALKDHSYNPGPVRFADIPKPNGSSRTLCIRNLIDRVVAKAYQQVLSPLLDQTFCDLSHGGRPQRSPQTALTSALHAANQQDRWYWMGIDLKDAFNHVPLVRLDHILRNLGREDPQLREMILRIAKASDTHGLQQGCALSPLLFNLYLDRVLDGRWRTGHPNIPMLRYLDDVMVLCQDPQEADQALESLAKLLTPAGFTIQHHKTQRADLRNTADSIDWLGFHISLHEGGTITPTDEAWEKLGGHFEEMNEPLAEEHIDSFIHSWLRAMGPALGKQARAQMGGVLTNKSKAPVRLAYQQHSRRYRRVSLSAFLRWRARMWWAWVTGGTGLKTEGSASQTFSSDQTLTTGGQVSLPPVFSDLWGEGWSIVIQTHPTPGETRTYWVAFLLTPDDQLAQTLTGVEQCPPCELPFIALERALRWLRAHRANVSHLTMISSNRQFLETSRALHAFDCAEPQSKADDRYWNRPKFWEPCRAHLEQLGCNQFNTQLFVTPYDSLLWNEQLIVLPKDLKSPPAMPSSGFLETSPPENLEPRSADHREVQDSPPW